MSSISLFTYMMSVECIQKINLLEAFLHENYADKVLRKNAQSL